MRWEYTTVEGSSADAILAQLEELAEEGWELVSVVSTLTVSVPDLVANLGVLLVNTPEYGSRLTAFLRRPRRSDGAPPSGDREQQPASSLSPDYDA